MTTEGWTEAAGSNDAVGERIGESGMALVRVLEVENFRAVESLRRLVRYLLGGRTGRTFLPEKQLDHIDATLIHAATRSIVLNALTDARSFQEPTQPYSS